MRFRRGFFPANQKVLSVQAREIALYYIDMKRLLLLLVAVLLTGCAVQPKPVESAEHGGKSAAPAVESEVQVFTTEAPTPIPTPTPTLVPTPEPTPTPNPYRGDEITESETNAAFWYCPPTEALKNRVVGMSYPEDPKDAPVKITDLRYVHLLYVDFDGEQHEGELLVHRLVADEVMEIFEALYQARYPLRSVRLVDDYGQPFTDGLSMSADNTSAYCCRNVTGKTYFSMHSYGLAIDVNPVENPYIRPDGSFAPLESEPYLDRKDLRPGMITEDDLCYRLFTEHGWTWGGHFKGETDYQHFSKKIKGVSE